MPAAASVPVKAALWTGRPDGVEALRLAEPGQGSSSATGRTRRWVFDIHQANTARFAQSMTAIR